MYKPEKKNTHTKKAIQEVSTNEPLVRITFQTDNIMKLDLQNLENLARNARMRQLCEEALEDLFKKYTRGEGEYTLIEKFKPMTVEYDDENNID